MTIKGRIKSQVRRFISERPMTEMLIVWEPDTGTLHIETVNGRGIDMSFLPDVYNDDGDPMTEAEKQDIVDALQSIVDEHNSQL